MKNTRLFVSMAIVKRYNSTAAFIFAHVSYHIVVNGSFNTKKCWPSSVKNFCGVGVDSYKKYLKTFIDDKILIKRENIYTFNFENIAFDDVFDSYLQTFNKSTNDSLKLPLIEIMPHSIDETKFRGKGAFHQRLVVILEAYAFNIAARSFAINKSTPTFKASSFKWLAIEFGCDWRTIRAAVNTITNVRLTFDLTLVKRSKGFVLDVRKKIVMKISTQVQIFDIKVKRYKKMIKRKLNDKYTSNYTSAYT
jgi:hypothetical protein